MPPFATCLGYTNFLVGPSKARGSHDVNHWELATWTLRAAYSKLNGDFNYMHIINYATKKY